MSPKDPSTSGSSTSTCDRCRVLKVKCLLPDTSAGSRGEHRDPCKRCAKAGTSCTFDYEFKRSGRPPGSSKRSRSNDADRRSSSPPRRPSAPVPTHSHAHSNSHSHSHSISPVSFLELSNPTPPFIAPSTTAFSPHDHVNQHHTPSFSPHDQQSHHLHSFPRTQHTVEDNSPFTPPAPFRDSIFGSARTALEGAGDVGQPWLSGLFSRRPSFDFSLPEPHSSDRDTRDAFSRGRPTVSPVNSFGPSPAASTSETALNMLANTSTDTLGGGVPPPPSSHLGSAQNTIMGVNMGGMGGDRFVSQVPLPKSSDYFSDLGGPMQQVEAVGSWSEFCFFVSLFMRHQHALVPLVHKPTFAMDVLHRRDQRDEAFRGLLFSIVTYTICQCPINMMSKDFSRERLLVLLEKCQRASRIIQIRHLSRPNLIIAASTELDILSSQATNKPELTAALFADAHRMQYTLRLNASQPAEGLSPIDIEMGRRIFWHLYGTDRTNVMNGGTMLIHHQEGLPPFPLEIDDEQLSNSTSHSAPPPPAPTYISGFVTLSRVFLILGECQHRHRTLLNDPEASQDLPTLNRWLDNATERLRRITDRLPAEFRPKDHKSDPVRAVGAPTGGIGGNEDDLDAMAGIQQANMCISALCVEFALLDLRLALRPEEDLRPEREKIAKKAYATLSSIPLEYLASNGEAMRGKVLRTILALFNASTSPEEMGNGVWDWWNMYSQVQFIQVIPAS